MALGDARRASLLLAYAAKCFSKPHAQVEIDDVERPFRLGDATSILQCYRVR